MTDINSTNNEMHDQSNKTPLIFKNLRIIDPEEKTIYCKKCVISNQRPRISFNSDGICSACLFSEYKHTMIDWDKRKKELEELCDTHRNKNGKWDVIVPSSGGKDSSYVAYMLKKEYGMHPLTVTWSPTLPTEIGKQNFENMIKSGFDNILGSANGIIHKKLSRITFMEFGDNFLPFIYGMINFPLQIATRFKIPLIFFGEDGELEYGGSLERYNKSELNMEYTVRSKFTSLSPEYWKPFGIDANELNYYLSPTLEELQSIGVQGHYFSYYENWKPERNYEIATEYIGFKPNPDGRSEGTYTNFASLDDKVDRFHYYMGFIKFGIGRATSDACHQIRDGILTRDEGVDLVQKFDDEFPNKYFKEFLDYMDMDEKTFHEIVDRFRRPIIWKKEKGFWKLRNQVSKLK